MTSLAARLVGGDGSAIAEVPLAPGPFREPASRRTKESHRAGGNTTPMSIDQYRATVVLMLIFAVATGLIAILNLAAAIVQWRSDKRGQRLCRCATFLTISVAGLAFPTILCRTLMANGWLYVPAGEPPAILRQMKDSQAARARASAVVHEGDLAPPFQVTTTEGEVVSLDKLRGKVVLLNFFARNCGPCLVELPHLDQLWRSRAHRNDFAALIVGREETAVAVAGFREKHGFAVPMAADPDRSIYSQYAHELIPRTFLIARDGTIAWSATGFVADEAQVIAERLDRELDQSASGRLASIRELRPSQVRPAERSLRAADAHTSLQEAP